MQCFSFHFQWELFRLPELECFDAMLTRLFKQELETIVMSYEDYRLALLKEMDRRHNEKQANQERALSQNVETKV